MGNTEADSVRNDPIAVFEEAHVTQKKICDLMEEIADGLPHSVNAQAIGVVIEFLTVEMPLHLRDECDGLFPLLRRRAVSHDRVDCVLNHLLSEHMEDQGYADELVEALNSTLDRRHEQDLNQLAYMLRSFFEMQRRHTIWEDSLVIPLARARLTPADLSELATVLLHHRSEVQVQVTL